MQINNSSTNTNPNFMCVKRFRLPTRSVLECVSGNITEKTMQNPAPLFKTFGLLFDLPVKELRKMPKTPINFEIYRMAAGAILEGNNKELQVLCNRIKSLPKSEQCAKIEEVVSEVGERINVVIDDAISRYEVRDGVLIS